MTDPAHLRIAKNLIGTLEGKGSADNPVVVQMYADVKQSGIKHDEVPWCAAFVGSCLERSGIKSTRSLMARSYLKFGERITPAQAKAGDIVVFSRGAPPSGHVAFFLRWVSGGKVEVLGGNQSDSVSVVQRSKKPILDIRRAPAIELIKLPELAKTSRIAKGAKEGITAGQVTTGVGAATATTTVLEQTGVLTELTGSLSPMKDFFDAYGVWIALAAACILIGFGLWIWWQARKVGTARVEDHNTGKTITGTGNGRDMDR